MTTTRNIIKELGVPFTVLVDETRTIYRRYGLETSYWRSRSPRTLLFYLKRLLRGHRMERAHANASQLGGDFIVDNELMVRFAHLSRDPLDRPDVIQCLGILKRLNNPLID